MKPFYGRFRCNQGIAASRLGRHGLVHGAEGLAILLRCRAIGRNGAGARSGRPGLAAALDWMRKGDILIVRKLDRPGRSLSQLETTVGQFEEEGFGFRSLTEGITAAGTPVFHAMISHDVLEGNGPQAVSRKRLQRAMNVQRPAVRPPGARCPRTPLAHHAALPQNALDEPLRHANL